MGEQVRHLVQQFQPKHYDLTLELDKDAGTFSGTVHITGRKIGRPSKRLTFHQKELRIRTASVIAVDKRGQRREIPLLRINTHKSFDEVRLHSSELLYPGEYEVALSFDGAVTKPMNGVYPCFFETDGIAQQLLATQFESHHAREAFPCIDEPAAKASFALTLVTPKGDVALANTPASKSVSTKGRTRTQFATTPVMSTYLLAFVTGRLESVTAKTSRGTTMRVWTTPDKIQHAQFALDTSVRCLEFFEAYFNIPYPLEKCDLVALPDFASAAMENWGLITFREAYLLYDPQNTSLDMKQHIALVIAHELAHQWFGNLVTMQWWTDLWLNEGFASWIEYVAVDSLFPEWDIWTQFVASEQRPVMGLDALEHTHPVEVAIRHPDEIRSIFDSISYNKGASVISMLQGYLGADVFRKGLQHYLTEHAYGNTNTKDLWAALEHVSQKPVTHFMQAWTGWSGLPVVSVSRLTEEKVRFEQKRFLLNPTANAADAKSWPIPLGVAGGLTLEKASVETVFSASDPLLLNPQSQGFFIVNYDESLLRGLASSVTKLSSRDRLALLFDAQMTAKAGLRPTSDTLALLARYEREAVSAVWEIIAGFVADLRRVFGEDDRARAAMQPFLRQLAQANVQQLGWDEKASDSHDQKLLRPIVLGLASLGEDRVIVSEALRRFEQMKRPEDQSPDLRSVIYHTAVRHGTQATFDKLWRFYTTTPSKDEQVTLASALTSFKQPALIKQALAKIDSSAVRLQDVGYWLAYSFMNRHAKKLTWQWLRAHYDWVRQQTGNDLSFSRMPLYAARSWSDRSFLAEFDSFWTAHTEPVLERSIAQGRELIEWQSAWRERDRQRVSEFFRS